MLNVIYFVNLSSYSVLWLKRFVFLKKLFSRFFKMDIFKRPWTLERKQRTKKVSAAICWIMFLNFQLIWLMLWYRHVIFHLFFLFCPFEERRNAGRLLGHQKSSIKMGDLPLCYIDTCDLNMQFIQLVFGVINKLFSPPSRQLYSSSFSIYS